MPQENAAEHQGLAIIDQHPGGDIAGIDTGDAREDLTVLGIAYEDVDDVDFEAFLEEIPVSFPILKVDVYQPPEPFGAPKVLPTTIVLDREGRAVKAFLGPVTREAIESYIESVD